MENQNQNEKVPVSVSRLLVLEVLLCVSLLIGTYSVYSQTHRQFEYKTEFVSDFAGRSFINMMNDSGQNGWSVISTRRAQDAGSWGVEIVYQREL